MRYIPLKDHPPPPSWVKKAAAVSKQLEQAQTHEERCRIIDCNQKLYQRLQRWLAAHSHRKCWFSEAKDIFSHWHVEHYRPKKETKDLDGNLRGEGYWWLTFDWRNLRLCGAVGNVKKGSFFPIFDEAKRATSKAPGLDEELPFLLDPADPQDPDLVDFDLTGKLKPSGEATTDWLKKRVAVSEKRYGLDNKTLEEARRTRWGDCQRRVNEYRAALADFNRQFSPAARARAGEIARQLRAMTRASEPLSRVARACLISNQLVQMLASN